MPPRTAISGLAAFFRAQVFAACILGLAATPAAAETINGTARAIDGDTLRVDGHEIRLFGIDAPEYRQTCRTGWNNWACGTDAAAALRTLVDGKRLACLSRARDIHGRTVATCRLGERDVALEMLAQGLAVALAGASPEYLQARDRARSTRARIWASQFDMPNDYRAEHPRSEAA